MDRPPTRPPPPPRPQALAAGRRLALLGMGGIAAALGGLAIGIPILFPDAPARQRAENPRVVPPLLRARMELRPPIGASARHREPPPRELAPDEAVLALIRAELRDYNEGSDIPARQEVFQLRAYFADDLWRAAIEWVAVAEPGAVQDAALLAAQGGTAWVWAGQLAAIRPGWGGPQLSQAELARLNPGLGLDRPGLRQRLAVAEALILDGSPAGGSGFAFDPASGIAFRRDAPREAPLPPLILPPTLPRAPLVREGRLGQRWFGLLPEGVTIPPAVLAQDASGAFLPPMPGDGPLRLWQGRLRGGAGGAAMRAPSAGDVLEDAAPLPATPPIPAGGLLAAGADGLLALEDPPSILLAELRDDYGPRESVARIGLDGRLLWRSDLPSDARIGQVLAEPGRLLVLATRQGVGDMLHAIATGDGRVIRSRAV